LDHRALQDQSPAQRLNHRSSPLGDWLAERQPVISDCQAAAALMIFANGS
jgi:hypothetical protein